jgi:hypothetical protein
MSTVMTKNEAIKTFIADSYSLNDYDLGTAILLPEFVGDDTTGWEPDMSSTGIRAASGENDYIRLGALVLGDGFKEEYRFNNTFKAPDALKRILTSMRATVGSRVPGKLIRVDSMTPFRTKNPEEDIKWADKQAGIACMVDDKRIFSRIEHVMSSSKEDVIIQHTNRDAISANGRAKRAASVKSVANSDALREAAAAKLAELKGETVEEPAATESNEAPF